MIIAGMHEDREKVILYELFFGRMKDPQTLKFQLENPKKIIKNRLSLI